MEPLISHVFKETFTRYPEQVDFDHATLFVCGDVIRPLIINNSDNFSQISAVRSYFTWPTRPNFLCASCVKIKSTSPFGLFKLLYLSPLLIHLVDITWIYLTYLTSQNFSEEIAIETKKSSYAHSKESSVLRRKSHQITEMPKMLIRTRLFHVASQYLSEKPINTIL